MKFKNIHKYQGFTLFELMVVVAIIAILSGIAIPAYTGYITNARITECAAEVTAISLAQKQYFLENNRYFPLVTTAVSSTSTDHTPIENVSGGYFRSTYNEHGASTSAAYQAHVNCIYTLQSADGSSYTLQVRGTRKLAGNPSIDTDKILDKTVN